MLTRAWRDATYRKLFGEAPLVRAFHRRQENSGTRVPGVPLVVRQIQSRYNPDVFYEVIVFLNEVWLEPGHAGMHPRGTRSRQYSIAKYGYDEAFELAVAWRRKAQRALERGEVF